MEQNKLRSLLLTSALSHATTGGESAPQPSFPPEPTGFLAGDDVPEPPGAALGGLLEFDQTPPPRVTARESLGLGSLPLQGGVGGLPAHFAQLGPTLLTLKARILEELEGNPLKLNSLNTSRREALAQHLDRRAGLPPGPSSLHGGTDAAGGLRRWIEGPRTPAQNQALQSYFEEIALLVLCQALLLKSWSDRGLRPWKQVDLGNLNWVLSQTLKPPLDREGWQIARQNIYSWYRPSPQIQAEIWEAFGTWRISNEGPSLITFLMGPARQARDGGHGDPEGYDQRFFKALWEHGAPFGLTSEPDAGPLRRPKLMFSPTLRDGSMVRASPVSLTWIGLESSCFSLMTAELVQLWWCPAPPPLWAVGNGLDAHSRDQLQLALGSPKPSLLTRISEMEACDTAFVLEEHTLKPQGRSPRAQEAQRLREQLDALPYFRKLRSPTTSLGCLQACVALTKLRPGGLLWWAREEPLASADGAEMLHFLLERAKIVAEWDFSELSHQLPLERALFPKHLYLLAREPRLEERMNHRPLRISLQGQIRSHVEIPLVLQDALEAAHKQPPARAHWQVGMRRSPTLQQEWADHWPDRACPTEARLMDSILKLSLRLAHSATIKVTPDGDASQEGKWSVHPTMRGLWPKAGHDGERRVLDVSPLPRPGSEAKGSGFMVLVPDDTWVAPLIAYLRSEPLRAWLEQHTDRRGDRWILSEQTVRYMPVPRVLLQALGAVVDEAGSGVPALPHEWERLAAEIPSQPKLVRDALERLEQVGAEVLGGAMDVATRQRIHAAIFVRAARVYAQMIAGQGRLLSIVTPEGRIRWRELLDILPKAECTPVTFSPRVKIVGQIPPHIPIGRVDRIRTPQPGVLLSTELGLNVQLLCDGPTLSDMLWEQLEGLEHPTWAELVQYLRVPRRMEIAEATAVDVLRSHGEQTGRLKALGDLVAACQLF